MTEETGTTEVLAAHCHDCGDVDVAARCCASVWPLLVAVRQGDEIVTALLERPVQLT